MTSNRGSGASSVPFVVACILGLVACGFGGHSRAQILYVAWPAAIGTLDPHHASSHHANDIMSFVYEGLVTSSGDAHFEEGLALVWRPNRDATAWTFVLRGDVTFHDGVEITAEAVKSSLERAFAASGAQGPEAIEVLDDRAFVVRFVEPAPNLLAVLAQPGFAIVDPSNLDTMESQPAPWPSGTGPYSIVHYVPEVQVVLERHAAHRDAEAYVNDFLVFELYASDAEMLKALEDEHVDIVFDAKAPSAEVDAHFQLLETQQLDTLAIGFNADHPALGDVRVRRALSFATDRSLIEAALSHVDPDVALAPWSFGLAIDGLDDEPYSYDPERAHALLAEAGFADGFAIELVTAGVSGPERLALELVQSMWSDIGVTLELVEVADAARLRTLLDRSDSVEAMRYGAWLYGTGVQPTQPPVRAFSCLGIGRSWEQYCHPSFDVLTDVSFDLELDARARYLQDLDIRLAEAAIRIPLVTFPRRYSIAGTVVSAFSADDAGVDAREVVATSRGTHVQSFDRSVPNPSRHIKLERHEVLGVPDLDGSSPSVNVGDVSARLSRALRGAGHEITYLPLLSEEGFVISTSPEWIDDHGVSLRESRFMVDPPRSCRSPTLPWWSGMWACVVEGTHKPSGTARVYVLRVSPVPWSRERPQTTTFASRQDLMTWVSDGSFDRLPDPLLEPPFDTRYEVDVLVYEVAVVGEVWALSESSRHEGSVHLEGTCRFELAAGGEVAHCFLPLLLSGE